MTASTPEISGPLFYDGGRQRLIARGLIVQGLLERGAPVVPDRPWNTYDGTATYVGLALKFDGEPRDVVTMQYALRESRKGGRTAVICVPTTPFFAGRLPPSLCGGVTIVAGRLSPYLFQAVLFVRDDPFTTPVAETPTANYYMVNEHRVTAWNASAVRERQAIAV